ncbi:MAG: L,D-transpeptidase family protein [Candidatus Omnitrophica bacterium]|nr:L,D-transpeptidase family protein [Candidatus Omnitrophota bacterium]
MNKRFVVTLILITLAVIFISSGVKNLALKRGLRLTDKIDSKNIMTLYKNAMDAYSAGDHDRAIRFFENLVQRFPDAEVAEESFINLTKSYKAKKDYAGAKKTLERFIERFPDPEDAARIQSDIEEINMNILLSDVITNESFSYQIKPGDTLAGIASKFNTTVELLKRSNTLKSDLILPGKSLKVSKIKFKILVNKSENILALKKQTGETIKTYIVATGENLTTPTGTFKIEEKLISPVWYKVGAVVKPDSAEYELGSRWIGLSISGYGIHGTNNLASIGKHITKGCIRMSNDDVEELYAIVPAGTTVTIIE